MGIGSKNIQNEERINRLLRKTELGDFSANTEWSDSEVIITLFSINPALTFHI